MAAVGVTNLSAWDFARDGLVSLDGDWEIYWSQLLAPDDFGSVAPPAPDGAYHMPSSWPSVSVNGRPLSNDGYATLRLIVKVPPAGDSYGLFVPSFNTAYKVWANGQLLAESGRVASAPADGVPGGFGRVAQFESNGETIEIVVQASSFEGVPGGPIGRFTFGPLAQVETWNYGQIAIDLLVISTCLIIGLYNLSLYLLRRKDRAFLWFGLVCVFIGLRGLFVGREVVHLLWPQLGWRLSLELIFVFGQLLGPLFAAFAAALYPREAWARVTRTLLLIGFPLALLVLAIPPALFFALGALFNGFTVLVITYAAVVGVRAVRRKRPGALLLMLSTLPLLIATIVEALGFLRIIPLYSVASFGILGAISAQTFTLSRNFVLAFAAVEALSERLDRTNKAYYRFVPREFLQLVGKEDIVSVELGDQTERMMTVLFADVRGFTSLSEKMSPEENFRFINELLGHISPIIRERHGFIDKYMGDGIMALFPEQPEDALRAAIDMHRSLAALNTDRQRQGAPPVRIGVGLHCGSLMLGTVGEPERMDGTVIADAVNTASRLESLTKRYAAAIIVSAETLKSAENWNTFGIRTLGKIRVKGKQDSTTIYEAFDGEPAEVAALKRQTLAQFELAVSLYQAGDFGAAAGQFEQIAKINPPDLAAARYRERSMALAADRPADWDGVETLTEK